MRWFGKHSPKELSHSNAEPLREGLRDYIFEFSSQSAEARAYAETHAGRLVRTIELTPPGRSQDAVLEMGAYMQITPALKTRLGYGEVRGCYLGPLGKTHIQEVTSTKGEKFTCPIDLFNAETDTYPYSDGEFATVICCELLEHLSDDPMHMMTEVNRILREQGHLVLSTPNACSLRAIATAIGGHNPALFPQFTARVGGNRTDPRHAREYTPSELQQIFDSAGFVVEHIETGPYQATRSAENDWVLAILRQLGQSTDLRDDVIHVVGTKIGPSKDRYPSWLYV
jgi:SAM-dependent methyltransferase